MFTLMDLVDLLKTLLIEAPMFDKKYPSVMIKKIFGKIPDIIKDVTDKINNSIDDIEKKQDALEKDYSKTKTEILDRLSHLETNFNSNMINIYSKLKIISDIIDRNNLKGEDIITGIDWGLIDGSEDYHEYEEYHEYHDDGFIGTIFYLDGISTDDSDLILKGIPLVSEQYISKEWEYAGMYIRFGSYYMQLFQPMTTSIPAGTWRLKVWAYSVNILGSIGVQGRIFKVDGLGNETELFRITSETQPSSVATEFIVDSIIPEISLNLSDRLLLKVYGMHYDERNIPKTLKLIYAGLERNGYLGMPVYIQEDYPGTRLYPDASDSTDIVNYKKLLNSATIETESISSVTCNYGGSTYLIEEFITEPNLINSTTIPSGPWAFRGWGYCDSMAVIFGAIKASVHIRDAYNVERDIFEFEDIIFNYGTINDIKDWLIEYNHVEETLNPGDRIVVKFWAYYDAPLSITDVDIGFIHSGSDRRTYITTPLEI